MRPTPLPVAAFLRVTPSWARKRAFLGNLRTKCHSIWAPSCNLRCYGLCAMCRRVLPHWQYERMSGHVRNRRQSAHRRRLSGVPVCVMRWCNGKSSGFARPGAHGRPATPAYYIYVSGEKYDGHQQSHRRRRRYHVMSIADRQVAFRHTGTQSGTWFVPLPRHHYPTSTPCTSQKYCLLFLWSICSSVCQRVLAVFGRK